MKYLLIDRPTKEALELADKYKAKKHFVLIDDMAGRLENINAKIRSRDKCSVVIIRLDMNVNNKKNYGLEIARELIGSKSNYSHLKDAKVILFSDRKSRRFLCEGETKSLLGGDIKYYSFGELCKFSKKIKRGFEESAA